LVSENLEEYQEFLESARPYYSDDLEYHNFGHVEETLEAAGELLDRCEEEDVEVDEEVVVASLAYHDAYYHKDAERFRYDSKEDLSKEVARKELREREYDEEFIQRVEDCIEATKHHARPDKDAKEAILVRAADLRGLMASYDEFIENTYALWQEHETLYGNEQSYQEWFKEVLNVLDHYGSQRLELTEKGATENGLSEFHQQLGANRQQFIIDHIKPGMEIEINIK
jgi:predicted metal-dependent HD superfamily phosphohydrolase